MVGRRCVIYVRISRDKTGGGLGVARQEADCRALAARHGLIVLHVYVDNDMSAYSGKPRKGYRKLMADIEHGRTDVVVAWHGDRLHRSPPSIWRATSPRATRGTCPPTP